MSKFKNVYLIYDTVGYDRTRYVSHVFSSYKKCFEFLKNLGHDTNDINNMIHVVELNNTTIDN